MERLSQMALHASDTARSALLGMLIAGTDIETQNDFRAAQERGALIPDLTLLSSTERSIVREHAALSIEESLKKNPNSNPLKPADGQGLAAALAESNASGDRNVQKAIESAIDTACKCVSRNAAIDGMLHAIARDLPGTGKFSSILLKALATGEGLSNTQRQVLSNAARDGIGSAMRTLAAICAGDSPYAPFAANELVKAGAIASNRDQLIDIMLEHYKRFSDKNSLLAALGDIASRDNPARASVLDTIRQSIENTAARPDSAEYKSAQKALLFLADNWGPKEINTLRHNLRSDMLAALPAIADKLSSEVRNLFINSQHDVLIHGSAEERLAAVQALGALGRYAGADLAADIGFFLRHQGKAELERAGLAKDKIAIFLEFAARALLSIMSSSDPKVQEAAFDSFRRQGEWPGMLADSNLRNMIIDYVQCRSTELEVNKEAMQLIYDAGLARPLSSTFRDLGVGGDKTSTQQLLHLAERAAHNYATTELDGKAVVNKILANAVTLNSLSAGLRESLTGSKVGIDMGQLAGQLINGTIDANHPPNNVLFTDLNKRLLQMQRELESQAARVQTISAPPPAVPEVDRTQEADITALPEEETQRRETEANLPAPASRNKIGLGRNFVDSFQDRSGSSTQQRKEQKPLQTQKAGGGDL
jgi:hypothetical protein